MKITEITLAATLLLCACSHQKPHSGLTEVKALATIKAFSTICNGRLEIKDLDGEHGGIKVNASPGEHTMRLAYRGRPQERDDLPSRDFLICVNHSEHIAKFITKPGHTYWFDVNEISDQQHEIGIWESIDYKGVKGIHIPAEVSQLSINRRCSALAGIFDECF